jgi:hypothetical protein
MAYGFCLWPILLQNVFRDQNPQGTTRLYSTIERSQRSIDLRRLNLTLFVNGDLISPQIERLLGEVYEAGCPSRLRQAA